MSNTVVLKNELDKNEVARFQYLYKEGNYAFEMDICGESEYAAVFYLPEGKHYTAIVTRGGRSIKFGVDAGKIKNCEIVKIIDINTESELFSSLFIISDNVLDSEKNIGESKENSSALLAVNGNEFDREHSNESFGFGVSSVDEPESVKTEDVAGNLQLNQHDFKFFNMKYPLVYLDKCKSLFAEKFEKFELLNLENHSLYIFDEKLSKANDMRIVLNKSVVPISTLYLRYTNRYLPDDVLYPERIAGVAFIGGRDYYVFGVLGKNKKEHQPFMGSTGFIYFNEADKNGIGYWIMYIDAATGRISEPYKKL